MSENIGASKEGYMLIPAYIIDDILKERARRQAPFLEELQLPVDIPKDPMISERPEENPQRSIEELDFFL